MSSKISGRGRPSVDSERIDTRFARSLLIGIDAWIAKQPDQPSRPEAVRRLVEKGLAAPPGPEQIGADAATAAAAQKGISPDKLNAENDG